MNSTTHPTAVETYQRTQNDIDALLDWIGQELKAHRVIAEQHPRDWGYAGDLGRVRQELMDLLVFLSPFSAQHIEDALADAHAPRDARTDDAQA